MAMTAEAVTPPDRFIVELSPNTNGRQYAVPFLEEVQF